MDLPIYGPPAEPALGAMADREVEVIGKIVDQQASGIGAELWVADGSAIRPADGRGTGSA